MIINNNINKVEIKNVLHLGHPNGNGNQYPQI